MQQITRETRDEVVTATIEEVKKEFEGAITDIEDSDLSGAEGSRFPYQAFCDEKKLYLEEGTGRYLSSKLDNNASIKARGCSEKRNNIDSRRKVTITEADILEITGEGEEDLLFQHEQEEFESVSSYGLTSHMYSKQFPKNIAQNHSVSEGYSDET